ncbi:MAG: ATP-binding response regulator [Phycisphaerales bacterium]
MPVNRRVMSWCGLGLAPVLAVLLFGSAGGAASGADASGARSPEDWCGGVGVLAGAGGGEAGGGFAPWSFFTNGGRYMPRVECLRGADGGPDWGWIIALIVLTLGVIGWYLRIYWFWLQSSFREEARDRDPKMIQLANIFLWCAICGYAMSILMFFWPAYRLLAVFLLVLNVWSWSFVATLGRFGTALRGRRLERELHEALAQRNEELERLVAERTEALVSARDEADRANAAKSRFLASMSHEIRTPMHAVLGSAEIVRHELGGGGEAVGAHLDSIDRNGRHLLSLIDDVLDHAKAESGRMEIDRRSFDVRALLGEVGECMASLLSGQGNRLVVEVDAGVPALVYADDSRLRQVLINLCANANKFTRDGTITVRAGMRGGEEVGAGGGELVLSVADTGEGMSDEQLSRLFEPFAQGDASIGRRFGGTGLGLMISREICELHGGGLTVRSVVGEGSVFTAVIDPMLDRVNPGDVGGSSDGVAGVVGAAGMHGGVAGARVLVVDDAMDGRMVVSHLLRIDGHEVSVSASGEEAVAMALEAAASGRGFGLVLMDEQMPGMDGVEATRMLRSRGYGGAIVLLTANATDASRARALGAGCDAHATKPIDRSRLRALCARWCGDAGGGGRRACG